MHINEKKAFTAEKRIYYKDFCVQAQLQIRQVTGLTFFIFLHENIYRGFP